MEDGKVLENDKLLGLEMKCTECGATMNSTGRMQYNATMSEWFVEYWCPNDQEIFLISTPETDELTRKIDYELR